MSIKFRAFGTGHEDPHGIPYDVEPCYISLFPVAKEREAFEDIVEYLSVGYEEPDAAWAELFVTMHDEGSCVGIAFLSLYRPLKWWFGNYYGIKSDYRPGGGAAEFLINIHKNCFAIMSDAKGIVFEIEPFTDEDIQPLIDKRSRCLPGKSIKLTKGEHLTLTAARRFVTYTSRGLGYGTQIGRAPTRAQILWALDKDSRYPAYYVQPGMQKPFKSKEIFLWLMVQPFVDLSNKIYNSVDPRNYDITEDLSIELFDFIYDHVFPSAFDKAYKLAYSRKYKEQPFRVRSMTNYDDYVKALKKDVLSKQAGKRIVLGPDPVLKSGGSLSSKAHILVHLFAPDRAQVKKGGH